MNKSMRVAAGVGAAAIILGSGIALASSASAETPSPTPSQSATTMGGPRWGNQQAPGRFGGQAGTPARVGNGNGYGAVDQAKLLADKLGVAEADVAKALAGYRATNTATVRGRDLTQAQLDAEHAKLAKYLAGELKVTEAKVLEALNSLPEVRQAQRTDQVKDRLDQLVKDGKITQAEADAVLKVHAAGGMGWGRGRR